MYKEKKKTQSTLSDLEYPMATHFFSGNEAVVFVFGPDFLWHRVIKKMGEMLIWEFTLSTRSPESSFIDFVLLT